jgi:hypothetical protein
MDPASPVNEPYPPDIPDLGDCVDCQGKGRFDVPATGVLYRDGRDVESALLAIWDTIPMCTKCKNSALSQGSWLSMDSLDDLDRWAEMREAMIAKEARPPLRISSTFGSRRNGGVCVSE